MKKNFYLAPETELCLLNLSNGVLQVDIDPVEASPVSGGTINSNSSNLWEEDDEPTPQKEKLWDQL